MVKEIINIKLTEEFRNTVLKKIDKTIEKVSSAYEKKIPIAEKKKLRNLTLDQINVNVSSKINSRSLWVFSSAKNIPIMVENESLLQKGNSLIPKDKVDEYYTLKANGTWALSKEPKEDSLTKKDFEKEILKMFLEDAETAAFYGATSLVK